MANNPILITGASQRLGRAIAEDLHRQGHKVIVTYRTERESVRQMRAAGMTLIQADFASDDGVMTLCERIKQDHTALRAIIHNASDWVPESAGLPANQLFNKMMQVHASAPYQINLALTPLLQAHPADTDIIHMTDYVQDKGSKKHIAYAASKAALQNLTLSFSAMLAPKVKVNSIAPALLMFNEDDDEAYRQKALKKSLLQRCPGAGEAVEAVNYLLRSTFVTGRCLHLDGGRHLL